jgi:hypothetical protein
MAHMSAAGDSFPEVTLAAPSEWMSWTESEKAWMSVRDADLLEALLLMHARRLRRPIHVLEWGAGRSTLWYGTLLQARGLLGSWLTIEHNREFFMKELAPVFDSHPGRGYWLVDDSLERDPPLDRGVAYENDRVADRVVDLNDYVRLPSLLGRAWDLVLVDGRKRRRCLLEAAPLLSEQGVTVLHDAWRPYYECAFPAYSSGTHVGDELWVGAQHPPLPLRAILPAHVFTTHDDE